MSRIITYLMSLFFIIRFVNTEGNNKCPYFMEEFESEEIAIDYVSIKPPLTAPIQLSTKTLKNTPTVVFTSEEPIKVDVKILGTKNMKKFKMQAFQVLQDIPLGQWLVIQPVDKVHSVKCQSSRDTIAFTSSRSFLLHDEVIKALWIPPDTNISKVEVIISLQDEEGSTWLRWNSFELINSFKKINEDLF